MKNLYLAWRDPKQRSWFPVGQLSFDGNVYRFVYTKGARQSPNFIPFARMADLTTVYESDELFPVFTNRLLSKKRPEYQAFLHWLNVRPEEDDPLTLLGRTGGMQETDSLAMFPCPEPNGSEQYCMQFFSHGLRYLLPEAVPRIHALCPGARLYLLPDPQNPHDSCATALRTDDPVTIVGYCPRYLASDFLVLLKQAGPAKTQVVVERVNRDAPIQLRLLCRLTADWPANFSPCAGEWYASLA
ncbi:MAG: HIRAN domain-containing protein [Candidatus Binatia bacterium]